MSKHFNFNFLCPKPRVSNLKLLIDINFDETLFPSTSAIFYQRYFLLMISLISELKLFNHDSHVFWYQLVLMFVIAPKLFMKHKIIICT